MSGSAPPGEEAPPAAAGSSGGKGGGWFAAFNAAVKRLKRQVLALHYANQASGKQPRRNQLARWEAKLRSCEALSAALAPLLCSPPPPRPSAPARISCTAWTHRSPPWRLLSPPCAGLTISKSHLATPSAIFTQDPRTGWLPRFFILLALAYVLSPVDLIPDFIPVLGLLDDLLILPGERQRHSVCAAVDGAMASPAGMALDGGAGHGRAACPPVDPSFL